MCNITNRTIYSTMRLLETDKFFYNFTKTFWEKKHVETISIVLKIWAGADFAFCRFTLIDGLRQIDWE